MTTTVKLCRINSDDNEIIEYKDTNDVYFEAGWLIVYQNDTVINRRIGNDVWKVEITHHGE